MRTGIEVAEAREIVLEAARPLAPQTIPITEALGRVLAAPIASGRTLPPADCSAMDGYAVRREDLEGASAASPVELRSAMKAKPELTSRAVA